MAAMDNQSGFMPLDQIGQGYGNPPANPPVGQAGLAGYFNQGMTPNFSGFNLQGSGQSGGPPMSFQDIMRGPGDFRSRLQQFVSQGQGGGPQNSNYAGRPANPPAFGSANLLPGTAGVPSSADATSSILSAAPASAAGGMPSQPPANPPASSAPYGYGQPSGMMGNAFNAAGFGGLGAAMGGQGSGARYWSRLNNIGGA